MRRLSWLTGLLALLALAAVPRALGQGAPKSSGTAAASSQPVGAGAGGDLHWSQRLGIAVANVQKSFALIDRVVLVPDVATYADELRKWSPAGRWPVLIEDDLLTPLFVRRFKPAELVRRPALGQSLPADATEREKHFDELVLRAVGGDPATHTLATLFQSVKYRPPGVVVGSVDDPAWTAAIALAAGRVQPIAWIDDDGGLVDGVLEDGPARQFEQSVNRASATIDPTATGLGDGLDSITLCRNAAVATSVMLPGSLRQSGNSEFTDGPIALSDFLGRGADGQRFAFVGWIFGDEVRCAYMAMCSLFLPRDSIMLANAYDRDGAFGSYDMAEARDLFAQTGFAVQYHSGEVDMNPAAWNRTISAGVSADVIWMNSSGNPDFFALNGGNARPGDVPVLHQPAALHLIHSWSLRNPTYFNTVGGRWLAHGVYAMVGSCYEPFLSAFHRPSVLAGRCLGAVPFLIASRRMPEDGFNMPWRVVTIGDPLMLIVPPAGIAKDRVQQPATYGENLLERARTLMKQADANDDPSAFAESISLLDLLGRDQAALQMWTLSQQKQIVSGRVSTAILPVLFRSRDAESFLEAWNEGGPRTPIMYDMLWHLIAPRAATSLDRDVLTTLTAAIRSDAPAHDVERLAPAIERALGRPFLKQLIARELSRTSNADQQRQLREIADRY